MGSKLVPDVDAHTHSHTHSHTYGHTRTHTHTFCAVFILAYKNWQTWLYLFIYLFIYLFYAPSSHCRQFHSSGGLVNFTIVYWCYSVFLNQTVIASPNDGWKKGNNKSNASSPGLLSACNQFCSFPRTHCSDRSLNARLKWIFRDSKQHIDRTNQY